MSTECKWLPKRILPPNDERANFPQYEEELYKVFLSEIYNKIGLYKGKNVQMRRHPEQNGKHESFYHIICGKDNFRYQNIERASRLTWGKAIIQHEPCHDLSCNCSGLLTWDTVERNRHLRKILFKEVRYLVILEERDDFWLYITSYYIDNSNRLRSLTKEYHNNKTKNALQV